VQLGKVARLNARRRAIAHRYTEALQNLEGIVPPYEDPNGQHVYYLYSLLVDEAVAGVSRDALMRTLFRDFGIQTITGYPPAYWFKTYRKRGYDRGLCPVAERVYGQVMTLPLNPKMTDDEVEYVIESTRKAVHTLR
jgi:perosamine synthetase